MLPQTSRWTALAASRLNAAGVILLESIDSRDPTAIQGLPLIWLAHALRECGVEMI